MIISSKFFSPLGLLLAALFCCCSNRLNAQPRDPAVFKNLNFRFIGPEGNRAIAVAGEPGNPMVNYIGAASGGLWKTEDGGKALVKNSPRARGDNHDMWIAPTMPDRMIHRQNSFHCLRTLSKLLVARRTTQ